MYFFYFFNLPSTIIIHTSDRDIFADQNTLEKYDYFKALLSSQITESHTLEIDWRTDSGSCVEIIINYIKYGFIQKIDLHTLHICSFIEHRSCLDGFLNDYKKQFLIHQPMFKNTTEITFFTGKCMMFLNPISSRLFHLHYHHHLDTEIQNADIFIQHSKLNDFFTANLYQQ
ncbi:MAG: hypothetical protein AB8C84_04545 [Oligoflexales bacterium]